MGMDLGLNQAEKYGAGGKSDRFEFDPKSKTNPNGDNRVRILALADDYLATHFIGKKPVLCIGIDKGCPYHNENAPLDDKGNPKRPGVKKLAYIYSYADEKVELVYLPYSVVKELQRLANDEDWQFDGMPMPYGLNIQYDKDAAPAEMYKVLPSPNRTDMPQAVLDELGKKKSLAEIMEKIKAKAEGKPSEELVTREQAAEQMGGEVPPLEEVEGEINVEDIPF